MVVKNPDPDRALATLLFIDIVGSTDMLADIGDQAWSELLDRHRQAVRGEVVRWQGREIDSVGDAFLATFDGPAHGVRCALTVIAAVETLGIDIRCGVHTGEVEATGEGVAGMAVHIGARIAATAGPGEVLVSGTVKDLVAGAGFTFLDAGKRTLKGVPGKWRLFAVAQPETSGLSGTVVSGRGAAVGSRRDNLPEQLTSFIGREDDVAETQRLLADTRLLTLTGVGGSGKTRLSLRLAAGLLEQYRGGVWLVELAPVTDPDLIAQTILDTLGIKEEPGRSALETVAASIGEKRMLLILDNCEHLIAGAAGVAASLLAQCPNLKILATSREILGVPGEQPFAVQSLAIPPRDADLDTVSGFDAVVLFTQRAATVKPGFQVTTDNAGKVAQICRRLDGMPLALELAAARMRVMSPEQIASRLDDRFVLLTGGARTALPRQQTLLATIDWSYQLLDPGEQSLFRSLSVFIGGFSLETAEAVSSGDGLIGFAVTDLIHRLVEKSLVVARDGLDGTIRYHLLETLRQFAAGELAASGRADLLRDRHAQAFAELVEEQGRLMKTDHLAAAMALLTIEHDNIRSALRWSIENGQLSEVTKIGPTMGRFWHNSGRSPEGLLWMREILEIIPDSDDATRAELLYVAGVSQRLIGDLESAKRDAGKALEISRRIGDTLGVVRGLSALAVIADSTGEYEAEQAYLEEALELAEQIEFPTDFLVADLGWTAWKSDDMEAARRYYQAALDQVGDDGRNTDDYLLGLAFVAWVEGDFEEAEDLAREASNLAGEHGLAAMSAGYQFAVALAAYDQGNASVAASALIESWPIIFDAGEGLWLHHWLYAAARMQPDPVVAVRIFGALAVHNDRSGFAFGIPIRRDLEQALARARGELDRESFDRAWAEGSNVTVARAGEWALEGLV